MTKHDWANVGHAINVAVAILTIATAPRGKRGDAIVLHGALAVTIELSRWAKDEAAA